jgi:hypothetical protein
MTTIPATRHAEDDLMALTGIQMLDATLYSINGFDSRGIAQHQLLREG